jgi:hypothetical protein
MINLNSLVEIASFLPKSIEFPNSWVGHIPFAAWVIQEIAPQNFVELGTHSGNSYFAFCQSVAQAGLKTKCFAIDSWEGDEHAGFYENEIYVKVDQHNRQHYAEFSQLLKMTFDEGLQHFADQSIELLHIDGLHSYEAVLHDFETWLPKLTPGAIVLFHDTNVHQGSFEVYRLWSDLTKRYPHHLEFFHSHGLGVLQVGEPLEGKKLDWLQSGAVEKQKMVDFFSSLGARQLERYQLMEFQISQKQLEKEIERVAAALLLSEGLVSNLNNRISTDASFITKQEENLAIREHQLLIFTGALDERQTYIKGQDEQITWLQSVVAQLQLQVAQLGEQLQEKNIEISKIGNRPPRPKFPFLS